MCEMFTCLFKIKRTLGITIRSHETFSKRAWNSDQQGRNKNAHIQYWSLNELFQ